MSLCGLLHIPKAVTVLVKPKIEIEAIFDTFDIYLKKGLYRFYCKGLDDALNALQDENAIKLVKEEFEIYPLTPEQIAALDKDFRAKVDQLRNKRASR